ncbi:ATP-binding protein [Candidatus Gottesmanbacteria bacterium]|nr:ATP-binding protein [Candidatus Gottesmanbacteria bacterium]
MAVEQGTAQKESPLQSRPRSENPLVSPLEGEADRLTSFIDTVNAVLKEYGVSELPPPHIEITTTESREEHFISIEIPYEHVDDSQILSMKQILMDLNATQTLVEGMFFAFPPEKYGALSLLQHRITAPQSYYYLAATNLSPKLRNNPYQRGGIFFIGERHQPVVGMMQVFAEKRSKIIPQNGILEIRNFGSYSEVELAYLAIMHALIMEDKLDVSTPERLRETLPARRKIMVDVYHRMLSEMIPQIAPDELFGLNTQRMDLENNLYGPLKRRTGTPMNTLLLGAPGVGKSALTQVFATYKDVVTVYLPVDILSKTLPNGEYVFKDKILPRLARLRRIFDLPMVVCLDDVESLFQSSMGVGRLPQPGTGFVNPEKRAQALTLLERLEDTYRIYLLATLNHPDVEAAFLRRFNPIYFPLPDEQKREYFLRAIIPQYDLEETDYEALITKLARQTSDLNYSGIAMIPRYLENLLSVDGQASYETQVDLAVAKAKQRTDVTGLKQCDAEVKNLLHTTFHHQMGFKSP